MKAEKLITKLFKDWKTLFRTRADVLDHLFFTIGNGYRWKNGILKGSDRRYDQLPLNDKEINLSVGPEPDDGSLRDFYPISEYSKICNIPTDVQSDWLILALEAIELYKNRHIDSFERDRGEIIYNAIITKFTYTDEDAKF